MKTIHLLAALPLLAVAALATAPAQAGGTRISVGVGLDLGRHGHHGHHGRSHGHHSHVRVSAPICLPPRPVCHQPRPVCHSSPVYSRTVYVNQPVHVAPTVVERPVYVDRPVVVERVVERPVERPVERTVYVDKPVTVERPVHVDREILVENGKTTIRESVDGTLRSITHAPATPVVLDANAEMALLCSIRDTLNRQLPMEMAQVVQTSSTPSVEVILRATRFAPYDRVTRRFVISAKQLTAAGNGLTIHFNADAQGQKDLAVDFQDLLRKMAADCQAQGGDWYVDNQFNADPVKANGRSLDDVLAALNTPTP